MPNQKPDKATAPPDSASIVPLETRLENAGQVAVTYTAAPPKGPAAKEIHARRALPEVAPASSDAPTKK